MGEESLRRFFSPCPRGLEAPLAEELREAGGQAADLVAGGVHFEGDWATCYRANLTSRLATRVLWRVGQAPYRNEADIHRAAWELPWPEWFEARRTLRVYVTAIQSPLRSLGYITVHIKDAICSRFLDDRGERPSVDTATPDVRVHVFLNADTVTFYLDTSGEPLFKRGHGRSGADAPLKENLAAGIIRLSGWEPGVPLLDPMCGSGTFLSEAAQIALRIPAGGARSFGFEQLSWHRPARWGELRAAARAQALHPGPLPLFGNDLHRRELNLARRHLHEAGLGQVVRLRQGDVLRLDAPADHGVLVTNPPYGVRLGDQAALAEFYPRLGDALKQRFGGWNCFILSADPQLPKRIGLSTSRRTPMFNGSLECRLLEYRITPARRL